MPVAGHTRLANSREALLPSHARTALLQLGVAHAAERSQVAVRRQQAQPFLHLQQRRERAPGAAQLAMRTQSCCSTGERALVRVRVKIMGLIIIRTD
jgi:hypothetical protein